MKSNPCCVTLLHVYIHNHFINSTLYIILAITVMFEQSTYSVDESAGPAQPVLVLSNPSSIEFIVQVTNTDGSATGEYCSILINY